MVAQSEFGKMDIISDTGAVVQIARTEHFAAATAHAEISPGNDILR
jgi:hypothetical protein